MKDSQDDKPVRGKTPSVSDMDALDTFPLSMVPLTSNSLKSAKLIKTPRMETTVELHNDPITGSYQILPEDIADNFKGSERDQELITKLALLNSYDVFSLRNTLGKLGLDLGDSNALELSDDMKRTLNVYAMQFNRPLLEKIFGAGQMNGEQQDLQQLLRDPDVEKVRRNLMIMTQKTGIALGDIPRFIAEYSDVYLSVAYYRYSFESIIPSISRFVAWTEELKRHREVSSTVQTMNSCRKTQEAMTFLSVSIRERLSHLQGGFEAFWQDINPASFNRLRLKIEDSHSSMGAVLCGLLVKMRCWERHFPDNSIGGPTTRAKFVVTEMEPGLERLKTMENMARIRLGLQPIKV